jgi:hypothetical protein
VAYVTQLNVTYSPLIISNASAGDASSGVSRETTIQPNVATFEGDPAINRIMFIALTDTDIFLTPFNLSMINPHVVAGPALYQAG